MSDSGVRPRLHVAALVLAAGRSTRMGSENKLLTDVGGRPLICRTVDAYLEAGSDPVVVVTGHEAERVEAALGGRPVTAVCNVEYRQGMSSSIRSGLSALPSLTDGVLVGLGDMPWVGAGSVRALMEAFDPPRSAPICVPVHAGRRGHPVLWAATYFDELKALTGDVGARELLRRHAGVVRTVEVDDPGVLQDLDAPDVLLASEG